MFPKIVLPYDFECFLMSELLLYNHMRGLNKVGKMYMFASKLVDDGADKIIDMEIFRRVRYGTFFSTEQSIKLTMAIFNDKIEIPTIDGGDEYSLPFTRSVFHAILDNDKRFYDVDAGDYEHFIEVSADALGYRIVYV
jgi:hypothetical protein